MKLIKLTTEDLRWRPIPTMSTVQFFRIQICLALSNQGRVKYEAIASAFRTLGSMFDEAVFLQAWEAMVSEFYPTLRPAHATVN